MSSFKKFYVFTGKGGVGKTTTALSFCHYLKSQGRDCLYVYFESNKIESSSKLNSEITELLTGSEINSLVLKLTDCAKGYIAKKLKSETIASWIVKTPFFSSLINMIPGFSYVIYLGQILEFLIENPERIIVLDSPSSGHALTMLESTNNFNEIFQDGIIYNDTKQMLDMMKSENFTKINIITLPTQLALNESAELKEKIKTLQPSYESGIYCNNCLEPFAKEDLPLALREKVSNEISAVKEYEGEIDGIIPYSTATTPVEIIKDLVISLENLV